MTVGEFVRRGPQRREAIGAASRRDEGVDDVRKIVSPGEVERGPQRDPLIRRFRASPSRGDHACDGAGPGEQREHEEDDVQKTHHTS